MFVIYRRYISLYTGVILRVLFHTGIATHR